MSTRDQSRHMLTRRELIRDAGRAGFLAGLSSAGLVGCAGKQPTPVPTGQPASTQAPAKETEAPKATEAPKPVTIIVWGNEDSIPGQTPGAQVRTAQVDAFRKQYPWITPQFESISNAEGIYEKILASCSAGNQPDLLLANSYWYVDLVRIGCASDAVDRFAPQALKDDFEAGFAQLATSVDGKWHGMHEQTDAMLIYYRKDLFEEAGVPVPTPDLTWEQFAELAQRMTKGEQYGFAFSAQAGSGRTFFNFLPWFKAADGRIVDEENNLIFDQNNATQDALQWMYDCIHEYKITPETAPADTDAIVRTNFGNGLCAMYMGQSWEPTDFATNFGTDFLDKMGAVVIPKHPRTGMSGSVSGGWMWTILTPDPQKQEAAWLLMNHLLAEENLVKWLTSRAEIPTRKSLFDSPDYSIPFQDAVNQAVPVSFVPFVGTGYQPMRTAIIDAVQQVLLKKKTAAEATAEALARAKELQAQTT